VVGGKEAAASTARNKLYMVPRQRIEISYAHRNKVSQEMSHARTFLDEVVETARRTEPETIETLCNELASLRDRQGRLFIIGVDDSASNCDHAVNDFRMLCGIVSHRKLQGNATKW
jgi:hypothetical protein